MLSMKKNRWQNWAGNHETLLKKIHLPNTIEEVQQIIMDCRHQNQTIRTVGASHSFSPVAKPDTSLMSLQRLRGLIHVNSEKQEATFHAGTYLYEIGPLLAQHHLALQNMGDIAVQTLAGAISTATHGTGVQLGSLADQVVQWTFVDGMGNIRTITRHQKESEALHVSLGLFGVMIEITLKVVPLYVLHYESKSISLLETLHYAHDYIDQHRHVEWFYFPEQTQLQLKTMDIVSQKKQTKAPWKRVIDDVLENNVFQVASSICKVIPKLTTPVSKFSASAVPKGVDEGYPYEIFPTSRKVKFLEMEYAVPIRYFEQVLEEIHFTLKKRNFAVHFPIEIRFSKGEAGWLSPTSGQQTVFFAFHMYKGMAYEQYFSAMHQLLERYGAKPHVGKINRLTQQNLIEKYPNVQHYVDTFSEMDPHRIFLTNYFQRLFKKQLS